MQSGMSEGGSLRVRVRYRAQNASVLLASCALVLGLAQPGDKLLAKRVEMGFLIQRIQHCPPAHVDVRVAEGCGELRAWAAEESHGGDMVAQMWVLTGRGDSFVARFRRCFDQLHLVCLHRGESRRRCRK